MGELLCDPHYQQKHFTEPEAGLESGLKHNLMTEKKQ
jgi:hypothetical protein